MDTELQVLAKRLVELLEVVFVLGDFRKDVHALLDDVLADDLEDLVLLEGLTRDVEGKIFRVDDTLDEVEVLGNEVLAIVHDEDTADIKLDVVALLLRLEEIEWRAFRNEENGLELELTLDREVLDSKVILPVVRQALVECSVLLGGDIRGVTCPDRLGLVQLLVRGLLLLDFLLLLVLGLVLLVFDLLDLGFVLIILDFLFVILDFLLNLLGNGKLNRIGDELGVLLDDLLDLLLLEVFKLILLEVKLDLGTTSERRVDGIGSNGESSTGGGLPDVLLVIVMF